MNWWHENLQHRLLISGVATVLIFLTLLGVISLELSKTGIEHEVVEGNRRVAVLVAKDIHAEYDTIFDEIRSLRHQLERSHGQLALEAQAMMSQRQEQPFTFRAMYLLDNNGRLLLYANDPLTRHSTPDLLAMITRPAIPVPEEIVTAYQVMKQTGQYRCPVHIMGADQVPVVHLGWPVALEAGQGDQVLVVEVDLRQFWRRIDEVYLGQTGRALLVSPAGIIIAHPDRSFIGRSLPPELQPVLAGYEGQAEYRDPVTGRTMLAAYSPVGKESGWSVVVEQEAADALAALNTLASITFGLVMAATVIATIITIFVARGIARPIQQLTAATQTIALTGDLSQTIAVGGRDEIGQLANHFNLMMASLQQADTALAEERNLLRTLIDNLPDYIYVKDVERRFVAGNEAVIRVMGGSKIEDLIGRTDFDFYPRPLAEQYYADDQAVIFFGQPIVDREEPIITPAGQTGWISTTKAPLKDAHGQVIGIVGMGRDITQRKQMEQSLQAHSERLEELVSERTRKLRAAQNQLVRQEKLATLGQLAAGVAHELRNPLGAIKNAAYYLDLVLNGSRPEIHESLEIIDREIAASEKIIRSLLAFAQLQPPARHPVDVNELVQAAIGRNGFQKVDDIQFEYHLDLNLPAILADRTQLQEILTQLLNNALQAMSPPYAQQPGGRLTITTSTTLPPESPANPLTEPAWVTLSVADTGVGIPPENMEKLFEPLFTTKAKGIGLGLAFVKSMVEGHGGAIEVASEVGEGSKFTVKLPLV